MTFYKQFFEMELIGNWSLRWLWFGRVSMAFLGGYELGWGVFKDKGGLGSSFICKFAFRYASSFLVLPVKYAP